MSHESQPVNNNNNNLFKELNPKTQIMDELKKALSGESKVGQMGQQIIEGNILSAKPEIENRQNENSTEQRTYEKYETFGPKGVVC